MQTKYLLALVPAFLAVSAYSYDDSYGLYAREVEDLYIRDLDDAFYVRDLLYSRGGNSPSPPPARIDYSSTTQPETVKNKKAGKLPTDMNFHFDKDKANQQRKDVQQGHTGVKGKTVVDDAIPASMVQGGKRPNSPNAKAEVPAHEQNSKILIISHCM
jgi:hypothetical protein